MPSTLCQMIVPRWSIISQYSCINSDNKFITFSQGWKCDLQNIFFKENTISFKNWFTNSLPENPCLENYDSIKYKEFTALFQ